VSFGKKLQLCFGKQSSTKLVGTTSGEIAGSLRTLPWRLHTGLVSASLTFLLILLMVRTGMAHEAWILTPEQMAEWNAKPKPELFTHLTAANLAMLVTAALAVVGWMLLAATGTRNWFAGIFAKLEAHERHTPVAVRVCLALTLIMAAIGLHPRHGTGVLEASTLGFPDLELRLLGAGWEWLAMAELTLAVALLLGLYVRMAAAATLVLTVVGLWLFDTAMLAYAGTMAGAATYLVLRGGRPLPVATDATPAESKVEHHRRERALFLVRLLTGVTFLWCGVYYKVLQPNLALAIIVEGGVPTFGLGPEAFVFGMALVEISAGALMIAGVLVQPIALALFGAFVCLGTVLGENPLGHVLFYGNLFALTTGGAGSWRHAVNEDVLIRPGAWTAVQRGSWIQT
jgi:hypothetical protein